MPSPSPKCVDSATRTAARTTPKPPPRLALRRGDPTGLGYYLDHGRIHVGDDTTTADQAFVAWSADRAAGLDSLLIASTNAQVLELNLRAQAARLRRRSPARASSHARRRHDSQRR